MSEMDEDNVSYLGNMFELIENEDENKEDQSELVEKIHLVRSTKPPAEIIVDDVQS